MEFINREKFVIELLQRFIDSGCLIYGLSVQNLLIKNKVKKIDVYIPNNEINNNVTKYKNYFECDKDLGNNEANFIINKMSKHKTSWKIYNTTFILTTKKPNPKNNMMQLTMSKEGISIINNNKNKSIEVLDILRKIKKNDSFDDKYVTVSSEWVKYLLENGENIYGSWISRYIICKDPQDMKRDIDILSGDISKLNNLVKLLNSSGFSDIENSKENKYNIPSINTKIKTDHGIINLDIHDNTKKNNDLTCDAFHNNLKLTCNYLTLNCIPPKLNYISALILTFGDIYKPTYTLMKPLPTTITNKGDLRCIYKPIIFSQNKYKIIFDYLETIKKEDDKVNTLNDIIVKDKCSQKTHVINPELEYPDSVINNNETLICLHCLHSKFTA